MSSVAKGTLAIEGRTGGKEGTRTDISPEEARNQASSGILRHTLGRNHTSSGGHQVITVRVREEQ